MVNSARNVTNGAARWARRFPRAARVVGAVALVLGGVSLLTESASALPLEITTYAGTGVSTESGDGGPATAAGLAGPAGAALDEAGNLYVADSIGHAVRKIDAVTGVITTVAGTGTPGSSGDGGPATAAQLATPVDVSLDSVGNLLIADYGADVVRKVGTDGIITTIAGSPFVEGYTGDGAQATSALLNTPAGLDVDDSGRIYIADMSNNAVRRVDPSGVITTIAGGRPGAAGDGGPATSARLRDPADVSVATDGSFFIADYGNHKVRRVESAGVITTAAGSGTAGYAGDGGPAPLAKLSGPTGVEVDSSGSLFIAEYANHTIRAVAPTGVITTVAGRGGVAGFGGDNGPASSALLASPARVVLDSNGDFFVADLANNRIRRISALGVPDPPTFFGSEPASPSNANVFAVRGSAADATTVRLYSDPGCTVVLASGPASSFTGAGIAITVPDDSVTVVYGTVTDGSGRASGCSVASVTITEDSTAPTAPTITAAPGSPSSSAEATWSFAINEGTAECAFRAPDGTPVGGPAACDTSATYDLSGASDGGYTFEVVAIDEAGNRSDAATSAIDVDRLAPPSPVIETSPPSPSSERAVSWTFTGLGTPTCALVAPDGSAVAAVAPCDSGVAAYDLTGRPDGAYTFAVFTVDGAGNQSGEPTSTFELDTTAPPAPALLSSPSSPSRELMARWTFEDGVDAVECTLTAPGGAAVAATSCEAANVEFDLSDGPDGTYVLSLVARDDAGNTSLPTESAYDLDTTAPPQPTIDSGPPPLSNERLVTWTFMNDEGIADCTLLAPDGTVVPGVTDCVDVATFDLAGYPDGQYTFLVSSADASGNTSSDATGAYTLDATAPDAPTLVSSPPSPVEPGVVGWVFTTTEGEMTCTLIDETGTFIAGSGCASGTATFDLSSAADGDYRFQVAATDGVGNVSAVTSSLIRLVTPAPTTTSTTTTSTTTTSTTTTVAVAVPTTDAPAMSAPTTRTSVVRSGAFAAPRRPAASNPAAPRAGDNAAVTTAATTTATTTAPAPLEREPMAAPVRTPNRAAIEPSSSAGADTAGLRDDVLEAAGEVAKRSTIPLALVIVVLIFLLVQNRVDRNDPKLALAPVYPDAELSFGAHPFAGSLSGPTIGVHRAR